MITTTTTHHVNVNDYVSAAESQYL